MRYRMWWQEFKGARGTESGRTGRKGQAVQVVALDAVRAAPAGEKDTAVLVAGRIGARVARVAHDDTAGLRERFAAGQWASDEGYAMLALAWTHLLRGSSVSPPAHLLYHTSGYQLAAVCSAHAHALYSLPGCTRSVRSSSPCSTCFRAGRSLRLGGAATAEAEGVDMTMDDDGVNAESISGIRGIRGIRSSSLDHPPLDMAFNLDDLLDAIEPGSSASVPTSVPTKAEALAELEHEVLAPVTDLSADLWRWQMYVALVAQPN